MVALYRLLLTQVILYSKQTGDLTCAKSSFISSLFIIYLSDSFKPTVAHRDMNSRNVLLKSDMSCIIADLGFCMTTMGSKLIKKGHTENAEQTSLTDVSTVNFVYSKFGYSISSVITNLFSGGKVLCVAYKSQVSESRSSLMNVHYLCPLKGGTLN